MKLLITGGNGFIGSNLSRKLLENHEVSILDNKKPIKNIKNIKYYNFDITEEKNFINILKNDYDGIIHLAAISRVSDALNDPLKCIKVNILGTTNILDYAREKNLWVIIGSTEEKMDNLYGISKNISDRIAKQYSKDYDLKVMSLKFSNVYGAINDNPKKLIPIVIKKALKNEDLHINNINLNFDYIHISDLSDGIEKSILFLNKKIKKYYNYVTLCSGKPIKIKKIFDLIIEKTNSKSRIVINDFSEKVKNNFPSTKKSLDLLGFKTKINFDIGLDQLIDSYKKIKN